MSTKKYVQTAEEKRLQLSKTLCYLLRHALAIEGLKVYTGNYVLQDELLALPQLKKFTARDLDENVKSSISERLGTPRFEQLVLQGLVFIRAAVGHSGNITIEPFPENLDSLRNAYKILAPESVPKLQSLCLKNITKNIKLYEDFSGVGDSSIVESIMNECKLQNKLNNANLKLFLIDELDRLDIGEGLAISDATLRRIGKQCPKLKSMRLVDCVALTDTQVQFLAKNCNQLWSIEFEGCKYVSDAGLNHLATHLKKTIKSITLKGLPLISVKGLENFLSKCDLMTSVVIRHCDLVTPETVNVEELKDKYKLKELRIIK